MYASSLVILAGITLLGLYLVYQVFVLRKKGFSPLGTPTIHPWLFYGGKIAMFASWTILITHAILVLSGDTSHNIFYPVPAAIISTAGCIMLGLGMRDLGDSLRVGLPGEATTLKTAGIYRITRNPIYVGVDLIMIASVLFIPGIINAALAILAAAAHHAIIMSEEKFLEGRFGEEWKRYKQKTRRYL